MRSVKAVFAAAGLAAGLAATPVEANDRAALDGFYQLLNSLSAGNIAARAEAVLAPDWQSIGDYSGTSKSRDQIVGQFGNFATLMPDLKWDVKEVLQSGNRYIVRSQATATPAGPFMGVPVGGKSFNIMAIDIHTVENGKIKQSYHVEDWASALRQLSAK